LWLTPSYSKKIKIIITAVFVGLITIVVNMPQKATLPNAPKESAATVPSKSTTQAEQWVKVDNDFKAELSNKEIYPYVIDVSAQRDADKKEITFSTIVSPATKPTIALDLADTMLRRYAALSNTYINENYKIGSKDYYGGLFDEYSTTIIIAPQGAANPEDCFVFDRVMTGMHTKQKIELTKKYR